MYFNDSLRIFNYPLRINDRICDFNGFCVRVACAVVAGLVFALLISGLTQITSKSNIFYQES